MRYLDRNSQVKLQCFVALKRFKKGSFISNKLKIIHKRKFSQNKRGHFAFDKRALFVSSEKFEGPCPPPPPGSCAPG